MKSTQFIHIETGEIETQIPIMEIGKYRKATDEEIEREKEKKKVLQEIFDNDPLGILDD